jgi:hypothetical protein
MLMIFMVQAAHFRVKARQNHKLEALHPHRSEILFSIFVVLKPGVPFLTMKALTCLVSMLRAQMTTTSANVALPAVHGEHTGQTGEAAVLAGRGCDCTNICHITSATTEKTATHRSSAFGRSTSSRQGPSLPLSAALTHLSHC